MLETKTRNQWGAIRATAVPEWVKKLIEDLDGEAYETGIESDKKLRGSAVNVDAYSYDEAQQLAVVQVRQCIFHPRRFNEVRKDYFLVGRNENGEAFAHPVDVRASGRMVSEDLAAGVRLALCRVWNVKERELPNIVRNGDVAFIPVRELPEAAREIIHNALLIRETHHVRTLAGGKLWATGITCPTLTSASEYHRGNALQQRLFAVDHEFVTGVGYTDNTTGISTTDARAAREAIAKGLGYTEVEPGVYFLPTQYYVTGPAKIAHTKGQHPTVKVTSKAKRAIWRVQAGNRANTWGFARPTAD